MKWKKDYPTPPPPFRPTVWFFLFLLNNSHPLLVHYIMISIKYVWRSMKKGRYKEEGTRTRKKLQNWMDRGQKINFLYEQHWTSTCKVFICLKTYKCILYKICMSICSDGYQLRFTKYINVTTGVGDRRSS